MSTLIYENLFTRRRVEGEQAWRGLTAERQSCFLALIGWSYYLPLQYLPLESPHHHGPQAAHEARQRQGGQERNAERQCAQDHEIRGRQLPSRSVAAGIVHLCGVWFSRVPDHPVHPNGLVRCQVARTRPGPTVPFLSPWTCP